MRRAFERALLERTGRPPAQDPALAALFHANAVQLARVYTEAEQLFPEAVFDDLVAGLGAPPRPALPAQTVVEVRGVHVAERLTADLPLVGYTPQAERVMFAADVPVVLSPTRLAFAGVVERGRLHAVPGAAVPDGPGTPFAATSAPVEAPWDALAPTLVLAFAVGPDHLSELGLFIDTDGGEHPVARALARSAWHLLGDDGLAREASVLRSREESGGVRRLEFGRPVADRTPDPHALPRGPFGPQCWVLPEVPVPLRAVCRPPRAVARALAALLPPEQAAAYARPLAWLQVQLPAEVEGVAASVRRVAVNCAAASNLEVLAERVAFGAVGDAVSRELKLPGGRHLVRVLGVDNEHGEPYAEADDVGAADELPRGRYRARGDTLRVRPARGATGRFDRHAVAHLLATAGDRGNAVQAGDLRQFAVPSANATAAVTNLTPARGGAAPPPPAPARVRFAELVRTRERVVTPADVEVTARAFDPRVVGIRVVPRVVVDGAGAAERVDVVRTRVRADEFADPDAEFVRLAAGLEAHLQRRSAATARVRVEIEGDGGAGG